jgi:hypothetical protein
MRIANYNPWTGQIAQQDYAYSGMGAVTPPEVIVAGEGFSRTVNQFAGSGMGFWSLDQLKAKLTQTKNEAFSVGGVLAFGTGALVGYFAAKLIHKRQPPRY